MTKKEYKERVIAENTQILSDEYFIDIENYTDKELTEITFLLKDILKYKKIKNKQTRNK